MVAEVAEVLVVFVQAQVIQSQEILLTQLQLVAVVQV